MPHVSSHAPNKPIWFKLTTSSADGARAFYQALFGWTYQIGGPETGHYTMCQVGDAQAAGLGEIQPGQQMPPAWMVYFGVTDASETCTRVKNAGGNVMMEPMDVLEFGRMAICVDSTGAAFGLWQPMKHVGATIENEHGAMAWSEVNTRDADAAGAFYQSVFGLSPQDVPDSPTKYFMLNQGDTPVGGVLQMTAEWGDIPPHWMTYFAVSDVEKSIEVVKQNGGTVTHGPFDTPYGRIAVVLDPQGAAVSIIQLA